MKSSQQIKKQYFTQILVEKAIDDIKKYRTEARQRELETQLPRWIGFYMQDLAKTNQDAWEIVYEMLQNREV